MVDRGRPNRGRGISAAVTPTVLGLAPIQLLSISNDEKDNYSDLEVKRGWNPSQELIRWRSFYHIVVRRQGPEIRI